MLLENFAQKNEKAKCITMLIASGAIEERKRPMNGFKNCLQEHFVVLAQETMSSIST